MMRIFAALTCSLLTLLAFAGPAAAQAPRTVRIVHGAQILSRPSADASVLLSAEPGTILDVLDRDEQWFWVALPPGGNGVHSRGWVRAADVQAVTAAEVNTARQPVAHPASNPIPPTAEDLRAAKAQRETEQRQREIEERRIERARQELEQRRQEYEAAVQSRHAPSPGSQMPRSRRSFAPNLSKYDLFAGYAALWDQSDSINFPLGWIASVRGRINDSIAVVGEAGGSYKSANVLGVNVTTANFHTFTAGPQLSGRAGRVSTFGQVLGGLAVGRTSVPGYSLPSSTGFVLMPGFGVDLPIAHRLGVRIGGEFGFVRNSLGWSKGFRLMTGLVLEGREKVGQ